MMEQAKTLSKLFNDNDDNNNQNEKKEDSGEQFEKMIKMAQMMQVISEIGDNNETDKKDNEKPYKEKVVVSENPKKEEKYYVQPFDNDLQTPAIRTIKAAIPHLEYKYQKNMGILVKVIELDNLLKKYKNMTVEVQSNVNADWRKGMLLSIKPQLDYKKQQMIEMLIKFMDLKDIMENLNKKESIQ